MVQKQQRAACARSPTAIRSRYSASAYSRYRMVRSASVRWALDLGYRHLDTAQIYGNEESVGRGPIESGVPCDEVFITTKFDPSRKDPEAELERSLTWLGLDYVDLYLVHWPQGGATRAWPGMEAA